VPETVTDPPGATELGTITTFAADAGADMTTSHDSTPNANQSFFMGPPLQAETSVRRAPYTREPLSCQPRGRPAQRASPTVTKVASEHTVVRSTSALSSQFASRVGFRVGGWNRVEDVQPPGEKRTFFAPALGQQSGSPGVGRSLLTATATPVENANSRFALPSFLSFRRTSRR